MILARSLMDCCRPLYLLDSDDRWCRQQLKSQGIAYVSGESSEIWVHLPDPKAILIDTCRPGGLQQLLSFARIRRIPVVSIHDLGLNPLASDIAIDGSITPFLNDPASRSGETHSGGGYMILDPIYGVHHRRKKHIAARILSIFINLGGGDARRYFIKVLEGLRLWDRKLNVIGVPGFSIWGQEDLARKDWTPLDFRWEKESADQHLVQADLAITAGGLAAYEALCTGTPLLALSYDHLQQSTIAALARANACIDLGPGDDLDPAQLPDVLSKIESERQKRIMLSVSGKQIVDGGGAARVSQIIQNLILKRSGWDSQRSFDDSNPDL